VWPQGKRDGSGKLPSEDALEGVSFESKPLVVSIVGGADMFRLRRIVGHSRIVRAMPNTPCLIGMAASAYAIDEEVSDSDAALIEEFFGAVGTITSVDDETLIDSVTGVAGSGTAYVLTFIEAMIDGGVLVGLKRPVARELAIHDDRQYQVSSNCMSRWRLRMPHSANSNCYQPLRFA